MPGGDRTGPMGGGRMTGWGRGFCGESQMPGFGGGGFGDQGRGFGRGGGGGGWGWRNRFWATGAPGWVPGAWAPPTVDAELQWLERRSAELEAEQEQIKARLGELETGRDD
jgi:hypothetical protein